MRFLTYMFILSFLAGLTCVAQKTVRTSGVYQIELTRDKSRAEVEKEAYDLAVINALERAFGRVVMQGNATYISNINTGEKTETRSSFHMIANTLVKGEVLSVEKEEFTDVMGKKIVDGEQIPFIEIKCEVTILAGEITAPPVEFTAFPLACLNINCRKTEFKDDEFLYFYFKSPLSGFLTIFLDDGTYSSRLLPYEKMDKKYECGVEVEADREYLLFSNDQENEYFGEGELNRRYSLFTRKAHEMNRLFIIFSKVPLNKPELVSLQKDQLLTPEEISAGQTLPKMLSSEDFQGWLNRLRSYKDEGMQVDYIDITITGKK